MMAKLSLACVVLLGGCGNVNMSGPDAARGIDAAAAADAKPASPCDLSKPFGAPVELTALDSTDNDAFVTFSADELTAYVSSNRAGGVGGFDLYYATRASVSDAFGAPVLLPNVNDVTQDYGASLSDDGLTLYFDSHRGTGNDDIYVATRTSTSAEFGTPGVLAGVNDATHQDQVTSISADQLTMYIGSDRAGDWDVYRATRASTSSPFGTPTAVGELDMAGVTDWGIFLTADGLTAYMESTRAGATAGDIFVATRASTSDGFGAPVDVTELNTSTEDYPTWVSPDGCRLAFSSGRTGGTGSYDLYLATRPQ